MIDLHTHILPGMDDGAKDVETSLAMLRMQYEQGVRGLALTPHFYRDEERSERFFQRREQAFQTLEQAVAGCGDPLPELVLGAEVTWVPGMHRWDDLEHFCLGHSRHLLLELPDSKWRSSMIDHIYEMMDTSGVIPVLAHLDRYFRTQSQDHIRELFHMGVPIQISAAPMLHMLERGRVLKQIKDKRNCLLISDCHDVANRPPNLGQGMEQLKKRLSEGQVRDMLQTARHIFEEATERKDSYAEK